MTEEKNTKKLCLVHYGIGWKDGVNTVLRTLVNQVVQQIPDLKICFIGGEVKEKILKRAEYKTIPELIPRKRGGQIKKRELKKRCSVIAKKLAKATEGMDVVVIENPLLGTYHLSAMMGFSLYAKKYKPKETKLFFRVHDLYSDAPHYFKNLEKIFSPQEIRDVVKGKGVDGFLVIDRVIRTNLVKVGVPRKKIFYVPNGVNSKIFKRKLSRKEKQMLYELLGIKINKRKKPKSKTLKLLVYPVRVVPRKNIEEAILLIYFIREITGDNYVLVISGKVDENDRLSRSYYKVLLELKSAAKFPIIFKKGSLPTKRTYFPRRKIKEFCIADLYQSSEAIIMTSLREGFGYPFLECWFSQKIIIGRRTPNVISTFEKCGFNFRWLYRNFIIPEKEPVKKESENQLEKVGARVKWLYESFLIPKKVFLRGEGQEHLKNARRAITALKDKELREKTLDLNKEAIMKQVRILENKKRRKNTIKTNLKIAREIYEVKKTTRKFLELVGLG